MEGRLNRRQFLIGTAATAAVAALPAAVAQPSVLECIPFIQCRIIKNVGWTTIKVVIPNKEEVRMLCDNFGANGSFRPNIIRKTLFRRLEDDFLSASEDVQVYQSV